VRETGLGPRDAGRCKNFYALGLVCWLFERPLEPTRRWINAKFARTPAVARANLLALEAGYAFGETAEMFSQRYRIRPARLAPGTYRNLTGNQALALGLVTAARLAGKPLFYGSYPITPASEILHDLATYKHFDVRVFSGRGRDCGDGRGCRGGVRGCDCGHGHQRPRAWRSSRRRSASV
jgi:2-oxoglutarate ferredoxin oxidoreductase subunit alpha